MRRTSLAALLALALALTGCGQQPAAKVHATELLGTSRDLAVSSLTAPQLADAQRAFGLDLIAKTCAHDPSANIALSPASAALALGMLDAGARTVAQQQIATMLYLPTWNPAVVAAVRAQRTSLAKVPEVQTSNHLYAEPGLTPARQTLDDLATGFGAGLETLDFSKPSAVDVINAQVKKDTRLLIPTLFDHLDASTQAVLTNAIHLEAKWERPFLPATDQVGVKLPKLKLSQTHDLLADLEAMGLPVQGDYSGFGRSDLEVTQVVQKVVIDVDEADTKAAAATGIAVGTSAVAEPPKVVVFDRPYLLLLQDTATGTPLFLVRVADPS